MTLEDGATIGCQELIVADGARSTLGRVLGREWHKETVYGVAIRGYLASPRSNEPWITSHLELRSPAGEVLPGYGWIFPLGNGEVNIGVGALASAKRPADAALRPLLSHYTDLRRDEWGFSGEPRAALSALLPMGGAVSGIAGPNWMLIGDAAACVNPLNGEGIDYGLETGPAGRRTARHRRPDPGVACRTAPALRPRVLRRAAPRPAADDPPLPAGRRPDRDALALPHGGGRARDGQSGHRRGRRLGCQGVAGRRCRIAPDRRPQAVQLIRVWSVCQDCSTATARQPWTRENRSMIRYAFAP